MNKKNKSKPMIKESLKYLTMKKYLLTIICLIQCCSFHATSIEPKPLDELVRSADHIFIGKIDKVDMIDKNGKEVVDPEAMTGVGKTNTIRLHITVLDGGMLKNDGANIPCKIIVPIDNGFHYSLKSQKGYENTIRIFLLKGRELSKVYPVQFLQRLCKLGEILRLIKPKEEENKLCEFESAMIKMIKEKYQTPPQFSQLYLYDIFRIYQTLRLMKIDKKNSTDAKDWELVFSRNGKEKEIYRLGDSIDFTGRKYRISRIEPKMVDRFDLSKKKRITVDQSIIVLQTENLPYEIQLVTGRMIASEPTIVLMDKINDIPYKLELDQKIDINMAKEGKVKPFYYRGRVRLPRRGYLFWSDDGSEETIQRRYMENPQYMFFRNDFNNSKLKEYISLEINREIAKIISQYKNLSNPSSTFYKVTDFVIKKEVYCKYSEVYAKTGSSEYIKSFEVRGDFKLGVTTPSSIVFTLRRKKYGGYLDCKITDKSDGEIRIGIDIDKSKWLTR